MIRAAPYIGFSFAYRKEADMEDVLNDDAQRFFVEEFPTTSMDWLLESSMDEGGFGTLENGPLYGGQREFGMSLSPYGESLQNIVGLFHPPPGRSGPHTPLDVSPSNTLATSFLEASWDELTGEPFSPDFLESPTQHSAHSAYSDGVQTINTSSLGQPEEDQGESDGNARKKRRRIPLPAKSVLDATFERLKDDPYVPQDELHALEARTGLSRKQIRTFFANARARKLSRAVPGVAAEKQQDPMQRFLSSSPEDEGIPEGAIRNAVDTMGASWPTSATVLQESSKYAADAVSVSESAISSNSGSSSSQASIDSANSRGSRRGRKRRLEPTEKVQESIIRNPSEPSKIYQCTFCATDFSQKYDWKRHEESVHFPQTEWVCMPYGPVHDEGHGKRCVLCDGEHTDDSHFDTHNCKACTTTPQEQHSFMRKDKLVQHLLQVHQCKPPPSIKTWSRPISRTCTMICGICGILLLSWSARVDHYASHYTSGQSMALWLLGRPGGILPQVSPYEDWIQRKMVIDPHPEGDYHCPDCPNRFVITQSMFHKRQAHSDYTDVDRGLKFLIANLSRQVLDGKRPQLPPKESKEMGFGPKLWLQGNNAFTAFKDPKRVLISRASDRPHTIPSPSAGRAPARGFSEKSHVQDVLNHLDTMEMQGPAYCTHPGLYPYRPLKTTPLASKASDAVVEELNADINRLYPFFPFEKQTRGGERGGKTKEAPVVLASADGKPVKMIWNVPEVANMAKTARPDLHEESAGDKARGKGKAKASAEDLVGQDTWFLRRNVERELGRLYPTPSAQTQTQTQIDGS